MKCQCEHEDHFDNVDEGTLAVGHAYGDAQAAVGIYTDYGGFAVCAACYAAGHMHGSTIADPMVRGHQRRVADRSQRLNYIIEMLRRSMFVWMTTKPWDEAEAKARIARSNHYHAARNAFQAARRQS